MERHYGMDWLRIGAFALLIFYHVGMVFVPWDFHVKTAQPVDYATVPMAITNAWRLTLLFVVSGYASRALFAKSGRVGAFLRNRNTRLLLPLLFGVLVIVPPQSWVELVTQHGYRGGFATFWSHDYFRFSALAGIVLPTYNHLWFVVYLWVYTLGLGLLLLVPGGECGQRAFDLTFGGWRAIVLPVVWLLLTQVLFFHRWTDTHDLIHDGVAHLAYFPAFLFGFGMAGSRPVMAAFARYWKLAAAAAIGCLAFILAVEIVYPGITVPPRWIGDIYHWLHTIEVWVAIAALIGVAEIYWNRDLPIRQTLNEAVFPFYLIHQTVIVLVEYWLLPLSLPAWAEFAILVVATVAGCLAFYFIGRRIGWLRPWIGLRRAARTSSHDRHELDAAGAWRRGDHDPRPDLA